MQNVTLDQRIIAIAHSTKLHPNDATLLKCLRDDVKLPYKVREAAANMLLAKQVDGVRQSYMK